MSSSFDSFSAGTSAVSNILSNVTNSIMASKAGNANASSLFRQSMLYGKQGDMFMKSSRAYSGAAKKMIAVGKANAKQERLKASQVQTYTDAQISETVKEGQQAVGNGKVAFAANGILLEDRSGSSVAMWEQDEAADNAYQQLLVLQNSENTIWNYMMSANQKIAEGYGNAAGMYGQAASMAAQAYSSRLQSQYAYADAESAKKAAKKSKIGAIVGGAGSVVGGVAGFMIGGPVGAAAGASIGSSVGTASGTLI